MNLQGLPLASGGYDGSPMCPPQRPRRLEVAPGAASCESGGAKKVQAGGASGAAQEKQTWLV
eukprot:5219885-Pyramimonas_sp.AAC.1